MGCAGWSGHGTDAGWSGHGTDLSIRWCGIVLGLFSLLTSPDQFVV